MHPRKPIALASTAFILVAAAAVGCGGGKEQVTAAELVQKGDRICQDEQTRFARLQAQPPANGSDAAQQTKDLIGVAEGADSDLGNLEPPEGVRPAYERYLDARGRAIDLMKKGEDAADNQDSDGYGAAQGAVSNSAPERQKLARALGFKTCSLGARAP